MFKKILFIDRDGTLIDEPEDKQIDSLSKLKLKKNVITALLQLQNAGFLFVMVSNQDGLGTASFPQQNFDLPHNMLLEILQSQGIRFLDILICPHLPRDQCECRKPRLGLVLEYMKNKEMDDTKSFVIGDRQTDLQLANNMGIRGILYNDDNQDWLTIASNLLNTPRSAKVTRKTNETEINISVDLDKQDQLKIDTGIGFFDHMLEQLAKHGGFNLQIDARGDLHIDEHHTVEDTALALGEALRKALGDKLGINRYGFLLPMDEARAQVTIDLSGRSFFVFEGKFNREKVGNLATELIPHFFRSLAESLNAALHITVTGDNTHHMVEGIFKSVGRALRQATQQNGYDLPTTKGVL